MVSLHFLFFFFLINDLTRTLKNFNQQLSKRKEEQNDKLTAELISASR